MAHKIQIGASYEYISDFQDLLSPWEFARSDSVTFIVTLTNIGQSTFSGQFRIFECIFGSTAMGGAAANIVQTNTPIQLLEPNSSLPPMASAFVMTLEGQAWLRCKLSSNDNQAIEYYLGSLLIGEDKWAQGFTVVNREQLMMLKLLKEIKDKIK